MIKIVNNIIPFEGFIATTVWPLIFIRKDEEKKFDKVAENHENIHGEQQKEMLVIGIVLSGLMFIITGSWWSLLLLPVYFWWYLIEYCLRSVFGTGRAYRNIAFEREAYANEKDFTYISRRKWLAWVEYMSRK